MAPQQKHVSFFYRRLSKIQIYDFIFDSAANSKTQAT